MWHFSTLQNCQVANTTFAPAQNRSVRKSGFWGNAKVVNVHATFLQNREATLFDFEIVRAVGCLHPDLPNERNRIIGICDEIAGDQNCKIVPLNCERGGQCLPREVRNRIKKQTLAATFWISIPCHI